MPHYRTPCILEWLVLHFRRSVRSLRWVGSWIWCDFSLLAYLTPYMRLLLLLLPLLFCRNLGTRENLFKHRQVHTNCSLYRHKLLRKRGLLLSYVEFCLKKHKHLFLRGYSNSAGNSSFVEMWNCCCTGWTEVFIVKHELTATAASRFLDKLTLFCYHNCVAQTTRQRGWACVYGGR